VKRHTNHTHTTRLLAVHERSGGGPPELIPVSVALHQATETGIRAYFGGAVEVCSIIVDYFKRTLLAEPFLSGKFFIMYQEPITCMYEVVRVSVFHLVGLFSVPAEKYKRKSLC